jgi:uncharacterized protein (TIGR02118 family)
MKKGTIKVSVLYPSGEGKHFDMNYYSNNHVALLGKLLGDAIIGASVENGLGGAAPGVKAPFVAMGNLYFENMESFQNSFGPHAQTIMGDVPNYTNIEPIVQVSEVIV